MRQQEKNFDVEWDADLYGELLTTGGGKERMTRYFTDINPDAWFLEDCADVDTLITHSQVREHKGTAQCLLRGFPWIEFYLGRCPHLFNRGGQKAFMCSKGSLSTFTWCYLRLCKMTCTIILNCRLCHHMRWERLRPCSAIPSFDGQFDVAWRAFDSRLEISGHPNSAIIGMIAQDDPGW